MSISDISEFETITKALRFVFCTLCKITDNIVWCVCLKRRRSHFFTEKKGRGPDRQSQKRQQTIEQSDNDYQKILVFHINLIWNFPSKSYCLPNVLPFTMGPKSFWMEFLHTINFMTWTFLTAGLLSGSYIFVFVFLLFFFHFSIFLLLIGIHNFFSFPNLNIVSFFSSNWTTNWYYFFMMVLRIRFFLDVILVWSNLKICRSLIFEMQNSERICPHFVMHA